MKTINLMINDYVQLKDEYYGMPKGTIMKIVEVFSESVYCQDINIAFEALEVPDYMLEPIPLTSEILEKDGFIPRGSGWYIPDTPRLDLGILSFGIDDGCGTGFSQMPNGDFVFFSKYVHEIQHCLRMIHTEKEMVL